MIKFFRRIRQRLLTENLPTGQAGKFSKYFIYAIGEIVLVVIGILIALQINNWNESNKSKIKEALLLHEMKSNLQSDRKDLEFNVEHNKHRIEYNEVIRVVMEQKIPYSDTLNPYFGNILGNYQLSENTSAWENLKSVGLDLISDDSLRYSISNLYANRYKYLENLEKGLDDKYQWDFMYPQILKHLNIEELWVSGAPRNYEKWINDEEFYEVIKLNLNFRYYMQNQYESNYQLALSLEEQIDRHLKTLKK